MKRFGVVFAREFMETLRSKAFRVISVLLIVLLTLGGGVCLILMNAEGILGTQDTSADYTGGNSVTYLYSVTVDDRTGLGLVPELQERMAGYRIEEAPLTEESIERLINDGAADACVIITSPQQFELYEYREDMFTETGIGEAVREALSLTASAMVMEQLGLDSAQAESVFEAGEVWYVTNQVQRADFAGYNIGMYVYNYVMIMLMFLVVSLYGQMVATRVATEKSSRTMEVLATSVSPVELLCGKVMGVGAAGLLQMAVFVGAGAALLRGVLTSSPMLSVVAGQILSVSAGDLVCLGLLFLLGFLLYAFIFGALGSMVSQLEDLSGVVSLPLYLFMAGYLVAIMGASTGSTGAAMKIASFLPFWSPVVMLSRMTVEAVPVWQIVLCIVLLALTAALMALVSARIYRSGMLRYGKPPRLREIINAARRGKR